MDLFGPLKPSIITDTTNKDPIFIFAMVDLGSRWAEIDFLTKTCSTDIIRSIKKIWLSRHETPKQIISDNGPQFSSFKLEDFLAEQQIQHVFSSCYNPTGTAPVERENTEILKAIRIHKGLPKAHLLQKIKQHINLKPNTRLRFSAHKMMEK